MNGFLDVLKQLVAAWREGGKPVRIAIMAGVLLVVFSSFCNAAATSSSWRIWRPLGLASVAIGGLLLIVIVIYQESKEESRREKKIEQAERRVQENPKATQAAWDLARVKLESYLNRNLAQVRSIYWLTVFVMSVGFALIGLGVFLAYAAPDSFGPGVLAAICGIIVNFIGATFLALYRATMSQATDYVAILERINAVGMSVQILETMDENNPALKNETTAELAKQLLALYSDHPGLWIAGKGRER